MLVEGARTDLRLMERLFKIYGIDDQRVIIPYNTNIYVLYNTMFNNADPAEFDILGHLKEHETDPLKKTLFNDRYSDILLIFDFDPQDSQFSAEKILEMSEYFVESTDMGKLYLNYPMVEAFYHMKSIPDKDYDSYTASLTELKAGQYKSRVNTETRNRNYSKFAVTKTECDKVIWQNIKKAWLIAEKPGPAGDAKPPIPDLTDVLRKQLARMQAENEVAVLCTCPFYIVEYDSKLIAIDE